MYRTASSSTSFRSQCFKQLLSLVAIAFTFLLSTNATATECNAYFPNGLQASTNGSIHFGWSSQLENASSNSLAAKKVTRTWFSFQKTCEQSECKASGTGLQSTELPVFPTNISQTDIQIAANGSNDLASGDYKNVQIGLFGNLSLAEHNKTTKIKRLSLSVGAIAFLAPGEYWFDELAIAPGASIVSTGTGTVRIFVNNDVILPLSASVENQGGSKVLLVSYGGYYQGIDTEVNAFVYSADDSVTFGGAILKGGLYAPNIALGLVSEVKYLQAQSNDINYGSFCGSVGDEDLDGVNDNEDQCPATPEGEDVDGQGCAPSQLDSDNDGVNDVLDVCEATPDGETVNEEGCSLTQLDTDEDGVNDAIDQCPESPYWQEADSTGCTPSQLDSDGDGVSNDLDAFPNDPTETKDSDGDGFGDNSDPDRDGDGYNNGQDAFPDNPNEWADADGDGSGDAGDIDRDNDGISNDNDAFPDDPSEYKDTDGDGIGDNSDADLDGDGVNNSEDDFPLDPNKTKHPKVSITNPATIITVGSSPITVSGTAYSDGGTMTVNGQLVPITGGVFSAQVAIHEGHNTIAARLIDQFGASAVSSVSVSLDQTPPYITVDSHQNNQVVYTSTISVSGLINDIVRGTVEASQATVNVNGVSAQVANRAYLAEGISLDQGANNIVITAADQVGNTHQITLNIIYQPLVGKRIELVSGQGQSADINSALATPLKIRAINDQGQPVVGATAVFKVSKGAGLVTYQGTQARGAVVQTNQNGEAMVNFALGSRSGAASHKVQVNVSGFEDSVSFYANGLTKPASRIGLISGNNQRAGLNQPLPEPLIVAVTDEGNNFVQGATVAFMLESGNGYLDNAGAEDRIVIQQTDSDGRASVRWTLGNSEGYSRQKVKAILINESSEEQIVGFTASALKSNETEDTRVSGVVLNNQDQALENVTVRIEGTTRQTVTDAQGRFEITAVPVGPVHLIVDGSTTTASGEYPSLGFDLVTIAGINNPMDSPIYMVKLSDNAVYAGLQDVEITLPEVPGLKLEVAANSVTFPDGSKEGYLSVTPVNSSKLPMSLTNGVQSDIVVTIQPTGAKFDPPARLSVPNIAGAKPGTQLEMFSYDHDLEEYVAIGLGTVNEQGTIIQSNLGVGVIKAGWHVPDPQPEKPEKDVEKNKEKEKDKDEKEDCPLAGNPVKLLTGAKLQKEIDLVLGQDNHPIEISRMYRSDREKPWSYSFDQEEGLEVNCQDAEFDTEINNGILSINQKCDATVTRKTGSRFTFNNINYDSVTTVLAGQQNANTQCSVAIPGGNFVALDKFGASTVISNRLTSDIGNTIAEGVIAYELPVDSLHENVKAYLTRESLSQGQQKSYLKLTLTDEGYSEFYETDSCFKNDSGLSKVVYLDGYERYYDTNVLSDNRGRRVTSVMTANGTRVLRAGDLAVRYETDGNLRLRKVTYPDGTNKQYHYEDNNFANGLTGITNERGIRFATWAYDDEERAISSEHNGGTEKVTFAYGETPAGEPQTITTNVFGKQTIYNYVTVNGNAKISHVEGLASANCEARSKDYQYYPSGLLQRETDWQGVTTEYTYDDNNNRMTMTEAVGLAEQRTTHYEYSSAGNRLLKRIAPNGLETHYTYDETGHVIAREVGDRKTSYAYSALSQLAEIDGPRTDVEDKIVNKYDSQGNLIESINALGQITTYSGHNTFGLPTQITRPNGSQQILEYDSRSRLIKAINRDAGGDTQTDFTYTPTGKLLTIQHSSGASTAYEYDSNDRLIKSTNENNESLHYEYDWNHNLVGYRITDDLGAEVYFESSQYDELDRLITEDNASSVEKRYQYNANDLLIKQTDRKQNDKYFEYDALNRMNKIIDRLAGEVSLTQDISNNLEKVRDQRGVETQFDYNLYNEPIKESQDADSKYYSQNMAGQIVQQIDERGIEKQFSYDALGRLSQIHFPQDPNENINFHYDYTQDLESENQALGKLTQVSDEASISHSVYGDNYKLAQAKVQFKQGSNTSTEFITEYQYDNEDRVASITYPSGLNINYSRRADGKITAIELDDSETSTQQVLINNVSYQAYSGVKEIDYGNGISLTQTYDNQYRISAISSNTTFNRQYSFDANDNITEITDLDNASLNQQFSYDAKDQLIEDTRANITFSYDAVGNRTASKAIDSQAVLDTYSYAENTNRLTSFNNNTVIYSATGNMTYRSLNGINETFTYNSNNRLSAYQKQLAGLNQNTRYFYNAQGQRVIKLKHNGSSVYSFYNPQKQLIQQSEYNSQGQLQKQSHYIWLHNLLVAFVEKQNNQINISYVHNDHLNTPRIATNHDQEITWEWRSTAFGEGQANEDVDNDGQLTQLLARFPGQYYDEESGLHYNYFRDYDPRLGRYVQSDLIGLIGGPNRYAYAYNNGISVIDPYGLCDSKTLLELKEKLEKLAHELRIDLDHARKIAGEEKKGGRNDISDANRHANWNKRMTQEINWLTAVIAGTGHELDGSILEGNFSEAFMDLMNNSEGREAGLDGRPIDQNNLWVINGDGDLTYNGSDGENEYVE